MIPLYKPYMPDLPELDAILHSGQLAYGEYSRKFEDAINRFLGNEQDHVLVTNSFNMAIEVATSLLDIHSGDEVIASPMACLASTQPFASQDIHIHWADIDPATGTLSPDSVERAITPKTKAIVHNHFCGYPGYIEEVNAIGHKYGIPVIDDGIECFGSEYKGKKIGNCGTDITIFSFSAVRFPTTIDGGALVIRDSDLAKKALLIRDCGIDRSVFRDELGEISHLCDINLKGHSATMSNVNAYIGIEQMAYAEDVIEKQRRQAAVWKKEFETRKETVIGRPETSPNYWVFGVLARDKRAFIQEFRQKGWYASGVHINNNIYSIFGKEKTLPGVEEFYSKFVALPCGWWVEEMQDAQEVERRQI